MLQCALYQRDVSLKVRLKSVLGKKRIRFHNFQKFPELQEYIHSYILDLIVIGGKGNFSSELKLLKKIKKHSILSLVPIVLYHPHPTKKQLLAGMSSGADEFLAKRWDKDLISGRLKMLLKRSQRDLGMNPTTRQPGMSLIQKEMDRRIKKGEIFAICYADLDDFKAYNDYYGYFYGDRLIRKASELIRDIVYGSTKNAFVGHIGGDDFIFLIPAKKIHQICSRIIDSFDQMILSFYQEEDVKRSFIITKNRRGVLEKFPIMTLSIAVVVNQDRMFNHVGEVSHMITDLKKYTKSLSGSNYTIERRKKY